MQGLGGKFGEKICTELNVQCMVELLNFSKEELQKRYDEKNGQFLYNLSRGVDEENIVTPRLIPKSISCSKMFPRQNAIGDMSTLKHWMLELVKDIVERIQQDELENNRRAKQMVVSFSQTINNVDASSSRAMNITAIDEEKIVNDAIDVIKKNTTKFLKSGDSQSLSNPIKFLGFNICKFDSLDKGSNTIDELFAKGQKHRESLHAPDIPYNNNVGESSSEFRSKYHIEHCMDGGGTDSSDEESVEDQIDQSSSSNKNYMQTYAEFYNPPIVEKVECQQCGKMIAKNFIQVHTDAHLAFQINEDQRTEFHNQLKRTHVSKTPTKKRQKTAAASNKTKAASIQKYFIKKEDTSPQPSTSTDAAVEMERCIECGREISIFELFEHMDFHAAKRLQNELMKTDIKVNRPNNCSTGKKSSSSSNKHSSNKLKKSDHKTNNAKNTAVRNITTFFQSINEV